MKTQLKKIGLLFALTIALISCTKDEVIEKPKEEPITDVKRCDPTNTLFQQLYTATTLQLGNLNVVTYDSEIHSYDFMVKIPKKICSIGYQSQPALASVAYKIEIYNNTTSTIVHTGSYVFSSTATSYVSIPTVNLVVGDKYTIRRIQTNWSPFITYTIGRLVRNTTGSVTFPQSFGDLTVTGSKLYQAAETRTDWAIPYIDMVFQ